MLDTCEIDKSKPTFGSLVRTARKEAGLTQPELAKRAGVTKTSIWRIENNRQMVRGELFIRLAQALGKPASYFSDAFPVQDSSQPAKLKLFELVATLNDSEAQEILAFAEDFKSAGTGHLVGDPENLQPSEVKKKSSQS